MVILRQNPQRKGLHVLDDSTSLVLQRVSHHYQFNHIQPSYIKSRLQNTLLDSIDPPYLVTYFHVTPLFSISCKWCSAEKYATSLLSEKNHHQISKITVNFIIRQKLNLLTNLLFCKINNSNNWIKVVIRELEIYHSPLRAVVVFWFRSIRPYKWQHMWHFLGWYSHFKFIWNSV
jgi:hypothetical protein